MATEKTPSVAKTSDTINPDILEVIIMNPQTTVWKGEAISITSENERGPFDILPMHANFITLLEKRTLHVNLGKEKKEFTFDHAVMYCHKNSVLIFSDI
jgi:F0F1-type ATP synthase epsilon subunit